MATSTTPDDAPNRNRAIPNSQGDETQASMTSAIIKSVVDTTSVLRQPKRPVSQPAKGIDNNAPVPISNSSIPSTASSTASRALA